MADKSKIEWCDATWTPIRARVKQDAVAIAQAKGYTSLVQIAEKMAGHVGPHCEKVSPGCEGCYSETFGLRCLPFNGTGLPFDRRSRDLVDIIVDETILQQPLHWRRGRRIFPCSQTDLFAEFVTDEQIDRVFAVMALCPQHTHLVLTKRAKRMHEYFAEDLMGRGARHRVYNRQYAMSALFPRPIAVEWPLPNVWLGVTAEDQQRYDERTEWLRKTPAARRFVSLEPLLGPINPDLTGLDWVITGGESGPGARPSHPDWFRGVRDACAAANVAYLHKQNGEWAPGELVEDDRKYKTKVWTGDQWVTCSDDWITEEDDGPILIRVGKKRAGRLLDGREHNEFPEVMDAK